MKEKIKEIILLKTAANTGKTSAINILHEKFIQTYDLPDSKNSINDWGDFHAAYPADDKRIKGNRIGFASGGDSIDDIKCNTKFFSKNECNICVTACRTRGEATDALFKWAEKNKFNVSIFDYVAHDTNDSANRNKAELMLCRLKYLMD